MLRILHPAEWQERGPSEGEREDWKVLYNGEMLGAAPKKFHPNVVDYGIAYISCSNSKAWRNFSGSDLHT